MNAADNQRSAFIFHFAASVSLHLPVIYFDFARCQRAGKCAQQSTSGGSNDIVQSRCVRFLEVRRVYTVVFGHRPVSAEINRIWFARQVSHPKRAGNSFQVNFRNISNVRHLSSKPEFPL
jgi:hypothetical protein